MWRFLLRGQFAWAFNEAALFSCLFANVCKGPEPETNCLCSQIPLVGSPCANVVSESKKAAARTVFVGLIFSISGGAGGGGHAYKFKAITPKTVTHEVMDWVVK